MTVAVLSPNVLSAQRLGWLDALRGGAALIVLWHHVVILFPEPFKSLAAHVPALWVCAQWISDQNKNAVLLFFVLSGFSIRLAVERNDFFGTGGAFDYAKRRAARILPLYWLALAWTALLGLVSGREDASYGAGTLVGNLLFLQTSEAARGAWFAPYGLNGPLWSLSYEAFYYLILPLVLLAAGRKHAPNGYFYHVLLIASLAVSLMAIGVGYVLPNPFLSFLSLWHIWIFGYVIGDGFLRNRVIMPVVIPGAVVIAIYGVLEENGVQSATLGLLASGVFIATALLCLVILAKIIPAIFKHPAIIWMVQFFCQIGAGSYAVYLLHYPLLLVFAKTPHDQYPLFFYPILCVIIALFIFVICPALERSLRIPAMRIVGLQRHATGATQSVKS